jgi:hypothetical protein
VQDVRKKWSTSSHENLVNKLVLIRDDNMARNDWKFGKITDTVKSKDSLIPFFYNPKSYLEVVVVVVGVGHGEQVVVNFVFDEEMKCILTFS